MPLCSACDNPCLLLKAGKHATVRAGSLGRYVQPGRSVLSETSTDPVRRPECCAGFFRMGRSRGALRATGIECMEHEIHPSKVALTMLRIEGSPTLKITISGKSTKFVET